MENNKTIDICDIIEEKIKELEKELIDLNNELKILEKEKEIFEINLCQKQSDA